MTLPLSDDKDCVFLPLPPLLFSLPQSAKDSTPVFLRTYFALSIVTVAVEVLVLKQANAGGVRHGCFIEISGDTVRSQR
jgi:hypothetical protein